MEKNKLTAVVRIMIIYSFLHILCFALPAEDARQAQTNVNVEIKQKEEAVKILAKLGENSDRRV